MPTISVVEKLRRMVTFLYGLNSPTVRGYLAGYGFGQKERAEGWALFDAAARSQRPAEPRRACHDGPAILAQLDHWENRWFPLAQATLAANYPALGEQVFWNLGQTSGMEVVVSVSVFLDRIAALGCEGVGGEARALLARRGLTERELSKAQALLERLRRRAPDPGELEPGPSGAGHRGDGPPTDPAQRAGGDGPAAPQTSGQPAEPPAGWEDDALSEQEVQARLQRAWQWYKEWSAIARLAIPRKDLRITLGVSARGRSRRAHA